MDKRLKQRLIGATVLVVLAIIIIPELLREPAEQRAPVVTTDMPPRPQEPESPSLTISLPSARPPESAIPERPPVAEEDFPMSEQSPSFEQPDASSTDRSAQQETAPAVPPQATPEPPQPKGAAIAPRQSVEEQEPEPSRSAQPSPERPATTAKASPAEASRTDPQLPELELIARSSGSGYISSTPASSPQSSAESGWAVQVGSFSVEKNAYQLRNRLHARDFPVSVERVVVKGRTLHRVRVGPQASRAESETIRERLRREANIEGQVVSLDD